MHSTETHLNGRLIKETSFVNIMSAQTMREEWVPGRWRWLLDGTEITEEQAIAELATATPAT